MSCYHPIAAWRCPSGRGVVFSKEKGGDRVDLPCGRCLGCRERRARDWTIRCVHESQLWKQNCFVTLTYGRNMLPVGGSLDHRDFQLFMKRMRVRRPPIRFFMCGEYGPLNQRPHYHAVLFNVDFADRKVCGKDLFESDTLSKLWPHGMATVQDANRRTMAYCARYVVDKMTGSEEELVEHYSVIDSDGVIIDRRREYCAMSLKPGIGAGWFERYVGDVYPHDFAVMDGVKYGVPKYYRKLAERTDSVDVDRIDYARFKRAREFAGDSTEERLLVREQVHKARVRELRRDRIEEVHGGGA